MTYERALELHDNAWRAYAKAREAYQKARRTGEASARQSAAFVQASATVRDAQYRLTKVDRRPYGSTPPRSESRGYNDNMR